MIYLNHPEIPSNRKVAALVKKFGATVLTWAQFRDALEVYQHPPGKVYAVVVDNGPFEAVCIPDSRSEWDVISDPGDYRPKVYLSLNLDVAKTLMSPCDLEQVEKGVLTGGES